MLDWLARHVSYPLWDRREGNLRLPTMRALEVSQWRAPSDIAIHQWERLKDVVGYAYVNCPFYRTTFDAHGVSPKRLQSPEDFRRLPFLSKRQVQVEVDGLISREFSRSGLVEARTGGSTGTSLTVYCDPPTRERRNGAALRANRWAGWNLGDRTAAIWGNPPVHDTFKKRLRNLLHDRMFYLDTMDLTDARLRHFADLCRKHQPSLLFGHAHSIFIFARFVQRAALPALRFRAIIATSMTLLAPERAFIENVFQSRVTNRYGCEEVGLIACECEEHDGLHINAEQVYLEFVAPDGTPAKPGDEAELVVTDLLNTGMPLIRYRLGDLGVQSTHPCRCGRGLPLLEKISGRVADFLVRRDGTLVAGVSLVERTLTAIPGIEQMQIVQEGLDRFTIRVVRAPQYTHASEVGLKTEFSRVFGPDVAFAIAPVDSLDQTPAGKFRFSICKVRGQHSPYGA